MSSTSSTPPLRVAIVNQFYAPDVSPTAHLAASLAEHRAAQGDRVTVIAGSGGYVGGDRSKADAKHPHPGLTIVRLWSPGLGKRSMATRLADYLSFCAGSLLRTLALRRQDVIVVLTTPPFLFVVAIAHKLLHPRTRVVLWSMDCYPDVAERYGKLRRGGLVSRTLRWINRAAFPRLDHVVCLDGAMRELLETQYGGGPDRPPLTVVPNWERLALFPPPAPRARSTDAPFVVLYQGNLGYGHRFDTVVEAARLLEAEGVVFRFVGGGVRWEALEAARDRTGLTNLTLEGYVPKDETPALLAAADAALITLDDLALGIMSPSKLHSSLATGLPIVYVGPTGSNVDEAIVRFGCGVSVRHDDVAGLVAAIRRLRDGDRAADAARSRAAFEAAYSDEAALPHLDAVIDHRPAKA